MEGVGPPVALALDEEVYILLVAILDLENLNEQFSSGAEIWGRTVVATSISEETFTTNAGFGAP